jgi:hypothetical protein
VQRHHENRGLVRERGLDGLMVLHLAGTTAAAAGGDPF